MDDNTIQVIRPFGPTIAKTKIPTNILKKLNDYSDQIINEPKKLENQNYGKQLAGNVKQEFKLDKDFIQKSGWGEFLANGVKEWIFLSNQKKITKFTIHESWIVRQFQNEYNPSHYHSGHVSGVGYLKVPKSFGETFQTGKFNKNGKLELIHGSKMFLSEAQLGIKPEIGDFYFFPHYLIHLVYPFYGSDEERRSVSFNASVDEKNFSITG